MRCVLQSGASAIHHSENCPSAAPRCLTKLMHHAELHPGASTPQSEIQNTLITSWDAAGHSVLMLNETNIIITLRQLSSFRGVGLNLTPAPRKMERQRWRVREDEKREGETERRGDREKRLKE